MPSKTAITEFEIPATSGGTTLATHILVYASSTAQTLFETFHLVRETQGSKGAATGQQQDILRSMLVLALAGLDAAVKQLVRDTVPLLSEFSESTERAIEAFAARRLDSGSSVGGTSYLVRLLRADQTAVVLEADFVDDLTRGSMQSVDQLLSGCDVLGVKNQSLVQSVLQLRPAFELRNRIVHEMDIDFDARNRNRTPRTRAVMVEETNRVLETTMLIVEAVDELIEEHHGSADG